MQQIVDRNGAAESVAINPPAIVIYEAERKNWTDNGGEMISLPHDEQSEIMATFASVGDDVSKTKPLLRAAYEIVTDAAKRTRQAPNN